MMSLIYTKSFQVKNVFWQRADILQCIPRSSPNLTFVQMATLKRWKRFGGTDAGFITQTVVPFERIETTLSFRKMIGTLYSSAIQFYWKPGCRLSFREVAVI